MGEETKKYLTMLYAMLGVVLVYASLLNRTNALLYYTFGTVAIMAITPSLIWLVKQIYHDLKD